MLSEWLRSDEGKSISPLAAAREMGDDDLVKALERASRRFRGPSMSWEGKLLLFGVVLFSLSLFHPYLI